LYAVHILPFIFLRRDIEIFFIILIFFRERRLIEFFIVTLFTPRRHYNIDITLRYFRHAFFVARRFIMADYAMASRHITLRIYCCCFSSPRIHISSYEMSDSADITIDRGRPRYFHRAACEDYVAENIDITPSFFSSHQLETAATVTPATPTMPPRLVVHATPPTPNITDCVAHATTQNVRAGV
jgi:hypothetical protein